MSAKLALILLVLPVVSRAQDKPAAPLACPDPDTRDARVRARQLVCLIDWLDTKGAKASAPALETQRKKARDILGELLAFAETKGRGGPADREDVQRQAAQHYLSGIIFFQKGDYLRAREEWTLSNKLDPANEDAKGGLERLDKIERGSR